MGVGLSKMQGNAIMVGVDTVSLWPPAKAFARFFPLVSHGAMQARSLPPQEAVEGNHESFTTKISNFFQIDLKHLFVLIK